RRPPVPGQYHGPAVGDRDPVKGETPAAGLGEGCIRHQIELAALQPTQAVLPLAGDELQLPLFAAGNLADQFGEQPGRAAVIALMDLGCVVVDADPDPAVRVGR
ncbi:MAG TPA: hypothetical protein VK991_01835, partial [Halomonas sp.]|nr:hypothetical protein [Halomonas sp.]